MKSDIGEVLITETEIKNRVSELAQNLAVDYKHKNLTIIGVLNGSLVFLSDLILLFQRPRQKLFIILI
jgi:hypoxanthine phosphoribosyltransferase